MLAMAAASLRMAYLELLAIFSCAELAALPS